MPDRPYSPHLSLSGHIRDLGHRAAEKVTLGEIIDSFGRRAFAALLFVLAIPNLLPLPPGSSTILGAPLLLIAPQMVIGFQTLWLPKVIDDRKLSRAELARVFDRLLPWLERVEQISRPRLVFMFGPVGDRLIGLICTLLSFVLILPIPLGNLLPALTIAVLAFSMVQRDGLLALAGYALAASSGALLVLSAGVVMGSIHHLVGWFGGA
ncbi:exopolysaccharide biosynthesis protein [Phenylobacterium sp.]|uniref:exopolysaccharide biosynthesis protein n=1 Tax=Phenylobacterium sp. TaxID=1871053 RepID=UPI0030F4714F